MIIPTAIKKTTSRISAINRWDHFLARLGINRLGHCVVPGLYSLGNPKTSSPVFVTANYTLSFDALRSALTGVDAYILVLDTQGINVWCAAGAKKFSTGEVVSRITATGLKQIVEHRILILPQLGASGVSAQEVMARTGFRVEFGPVRADDLPEYLRTKEATASMRLVRFTLRDRLAVIPVELTKASPYLIASLVILYFIGGSPTAVAGAGAFLSGLFLFPILLPYLPTPCFSTKGLILGGITALPFAVLPLMRMPDANLWVRAGISLTALLAMPPVTAFLALNFTGSTPITSKTGVRREIITYVPVIAWMFACGAVLGIAMTISSLL